MMFEKISTKINISPLEFYDLTPSEINALSIQIYKDEMKEIDFEKAKLEATMHAVTLGIANLKKNGKKYRLFEDEVKKITNKISKEEKREEMEYFRKMVI